MLCRSHLHPPLDSPWSPMSHGADVRVDRAAGRTHTPNRTLLRFILKPTGALHARQRCAANGDESVDNSQCGGKVGDRVWMNLMDPHTIHIFRMLVDGSASPRRGSAHEPDRRASTQDRQ